MANKKLDALVFSTAKNKDEIIQDTVSTLNSRENKNPDNKYIAQVTHVYKDGENAGKQYYIVSDALKNEKSLDSNVLDINVGLSVEQIQALIAEAQLNGANISTDTLTSLITQELAKNPANITEQRVQELITQSISSKVSETRVNELIDNKLLENSVKVVNVESDGVIDISKGDYFRLNMSQSMTLQLKNEPSSVAQPVYSFLLEILNGDRYALTWFDSISWSKGLLPSFENNRRSLFAFIVTDSIIGINVSKELDTKPRLRKERA